MDDALVPDRGDRDARLAQLVGVGLALVAQDVGLTGDDEGGRETGLTPEQDALAKQLLRLITADVTN